MNAATASEQRNQASAPGDLIDALNKLLITSRKLEARGWFRPHKCADGPTLGDMANMTLALALLSQIHVLTDGAYQQIGAAMKDVSPEEEKTARLAVIEEILQVHLEVGDIVTHTRCAGILEEHAYTGRDGTWLCGKPTRDTTRIGGTSYPANDIHPRNVTHINRVPLDVVPFLAGNRKKAKP